MADTKISAMSASAQLGGTVFPVVDSGANKIGSIDSDGALSANSDAKVPTQKAVKTYADTKASSTHTHAQGDITNLVTDLAAKAASVHSHAQSDILGLVAALAAYTGNAATVAEGLMGVHITADAEIVA